MKKIAATYLFTPENQLLKNGVLICDPDGTILDIATTGDNMKEQAGMEYYSGILVPGFVNTHCHLELSYLKGKIKEKAGMGEFLGQINQLRNDKPEDPDNLFRIIDRKMWTAGIAATGDIVNSADTIKVKQNSNIYYHTFIETFGFHPARAERAFNFALKVQRQFKGEKLSSSIVPHSPYSVSEPLFHKVAENARAKHSLISIHNQESKAETQFFATGDGPVADHFKHNLNLDISHWKPTGISPLLSILNYLPAENRLILVHNTFTQKSDIEELKKRRNLENTFFTLCPNSNLYIENQLPPITLFQEENLKVCIGTDSLASNNELSVLSELVTLQHHFPELQLEELLNWACLTGAKALGIEDKFGSFEPGKKPGINLITGVDFNTKKLSSKCKLKRLC